MNNYTNITPPSLKKTNYTSAILGGAITSALVSSAVLWLAWHDLPWLPKPVDPLGSHMLYWLKGTINHFSNGRIWASDWEHYQQHLDYLSRSGNPNIIKLRVAVSGIAGIVAGLYAAWKLSTPQDSLIHIRGRHFFKGSEAVKQTKHESKIEIKASGLGIYIHPQIPISIDRETRHVLVMGATGSGKTLVMWHLINQVTDRGDRAIIYDNKGEFTTSIKKCTLFAPWDERSFAWDVGRDCINKQDAREFAARLIPSNDKDPMWSNASRAILTGLIVSLQSRHGTEWGFKELANLIPLSVDAIRDIIEQHNPEALRSVEEESKTTQSILINLSAFVAIISDLANAWGDKPKEKRFSLRAWLADKTNCKVLVLQGSGQNTLLTKAYVNAMISTITAQVTSPSYNDSKTRKIWVFLDELPQLGKIEDLSPLMAVGRSKGIRVVIGTQDISQLKAIYGQDGTNAWASMIGTSIYGRVAGGDTAEWISKRIGEREVERPNEVWSSRNGQPTTSTSYAREMIPLVLPSQLQSELGRQNKSVRMLIDGFSKGVYQLDYPIDNLHRYRKSHVPHIKKQGQHNQAANAISLTGATATAVATPKEGIDTPKRKFKLRPSPNSDLEHGNQL